MSETVEELQNRIDTCRKKLKELELNAGRLRSMISILEERLEARTCRKKTHEMRGRK